MIIVQAPNRISFAGDGTDLPALYRHETGEVPSTAINEHMYVTMGEHFEDSIRLEYLRTKIIESPENLKRGLVRKALVVLVDETLEFTHADGLPVRRVRRYRDARDYHISRTESHLE